MYTKYEEYALSVMSGGDSNPPKINGKLNFKDDWSQTAFAIAINLSKKGYFEMEEFRQLMIKTIKDWENSHDLNDKSCYGVSPDKFVKYDDIMFIVDNLWLTHFVEDAETPINNYTWVEYNNIYNKLRDKWPYVFNYYDNVHEEETIRPIDRGLLG